MRRDLLFKTFLPTLVLGLIAVLAGTGFAQGRGHGRDKQGGGQPQPQQVQRGGDGGQRQAMQQQRQQQAAQQNQQRQQQMQAARQQQMQQRAAQQDQQRQQWQQQRQQQMQAGRQQQMQQRAAQQDQQRQAWQQQRQQQMQAARQQQMQQRAAQQNQRGRDFQLERRQQREMMQQQRQQQMQAAREPRFENRDRGQRRDTRVRDMRDQRRLETRAAREAFRQQRVQQQPSADPRVFAERGRRGDLEVMRRQAEPRSDPWFDRDARRAERRAMRADRENQFARERENVQSAVIDRAIANTWPSAIWQTSGDTWRDRREGEWRRGDWDNDNDQGDNWDGFWSSYQSYPVFDPVYSYGGYPAYETYNYTYNVYPSWPAYPMYQSYYTAPSFWDYQPSVVYYPGYDSYPYYVDSYHAYDYGVSWKQELLRAVIGAFFGGGLDNFYDTRPVYAYYDPNPYNYSSSYPSYGQYYYDQPYSFGYAVPYGYSTPVYYDNTYSNYGYDGYDPVYFGGLPYTDVVDIYSNNYNGELIRRAIAAGYYQGLLEGRSARNLGWGDRYYYDPYVYQESVYDPYSVSIGENRRHFSEGYELGYRDALADVGYSNAGYSDMAYADYGNDIDLVSLVTGSVATFRF